MHNNSITTVQGVYLDKVIIKQYYEAVSEAMCCNGFPMKDFAAKYPEAYKHLGAVHRKRTAIRSSIEAMREISKDLYFGTLTYNKAKDVNKITTKRKEAFKILNSLFEYVVLVEEFGESGSRYHIHFVGMFRHGKTFADFTKVWHSRQNLRALARGENVAQYLCKYFTKDLPRVRRNKALVHLTDKYKRARILSRLFPSEKSFVPESVCKNYHFINALDEL